MKRGLVLLVLAFLVVSIIGCSASKSKYIGQPFKYEWADVCKCDTLPSSCTLPTKHFTFEFDVRQLNDNEYEIDGHATLVAEEHKTIGQLEAGSRFIFLLGKEGIITDSVSANASGDLWSKVPFKTQFISESGFDAIIASYKLTYKR